MNFGNSKGLELIPSEHLQLTFGLPPYIQHNRPNGSRPTLDWRVLGFTAGTAILTCVLFGLAPALSRLTFRLGKLLIMVIHRPIMMPAQA